MSHHRATPDPILYSFKDKDELAKSLADFVLDSQDEAINKRGSFKIAISGGSLAATLAGLLQREGVQWDKWEVFFADERVVPLEHEESNYKIVNDNLLAKIPAPGIPREQIHTIDVTQLNEPEEVAEEYEKQLMSIFAGKNSVAFPRFDLILLGMGPDGHTCSLFPGHPLINEELRWVAWLDDSPKPPSTRITLTFPVLNHAHRAAFVVSGDSKQDILQRVFDSHAAKASAATTAAAAATTDTAPEPAPAKGDELPCSRVKPISPGRVFWFSDEAATAKVKSFPITTFRLPLGDGKSQAQL